MTTTEAKKNNNKWIWIGLAGAALFCLCSVGVAVLLFARIGQQFQEGMKTDPQGASEAAHAIADYELPEGYQEQIAMDFFTYTMVMIGPEETLSSDPSAGPTIMLAQFEMAANQPQMQEQMRRSFEQQGGRRGVRMEVVEVKQMTIRGEEVDVTILEGKDDKGLILRELVTVFPGKNGTAFLMIIGPAQFWDKEEIDQFVESIR
jgi:hypothetical protein